MMRDDEAIVATNPAVHELLPARQYFLDPGTFSRIEAFNRACYRPLTPLTLALDHRQSGMAPAGFRRTNLILHALTAWLVLGFLVTLLDELGPDLTPRTRAGLAAAAAALFAVHPISAFSVQYISNRSLLWLSLGYYATLWSHVASWRSGRPGWALARTVGLYLVCLCGKESAVVLPATALLLELARPAGSVTKRRAATRVGVLGATAVAYLGLRAYLGLGLEQSNTQPTGLGALAYVLGQLRALMETYLPAFVWPAPIRWEPVGPPGTLGDPGAWLSSACVLAVMTWCLYRRRERPLVAVGLLAFPMTMLPTILLAQPRPILFYRPYPGSPFLFLALLSAASRWGGRRVVVATCTLLMGLGYASYQVGADHVDAATVWTKSVRFGGLPRAKYMLAKTIVDPDLRLAALDRLVVLHPNFSLTYVTRAQELLLRGRSADALADLRTAVRLEARVPDYFLYLAVAARATGASSAAQEAISRMRSLGWSPSWTSALGFAERAISLDRPALARDVLGYLSPAGAPHWTVPYTRGVAHHQLGELANAADAYRQALERGGREVRVWRNYGMVLRQLGRCDAAREALERVLVLAPGDPVARGNLELCDPAPQP
jgi:tetratricopeptide (TPR) repeat protein